jgi:AraC-like DNA-binding protein
VAPKTWLVRRRIHHAALRLDESDDPVSVVASDLGYPDLFLFSRQFKMVMGRSPRHYRARSQ